MSKLLKALEKQSKTEIVLPDSGLTCILRPLTTAEDNLLTTSNLLYIKSVYDTLLEVVHKCIIQLGETKQPDFREFLFNVTQSDLQLIMLTLLGVSYNSLNIQYKCNHCGFEGEKSVETKKLQIKNITQPEFNLKPIEIEMKDIGAKLIFEPVVSTLTDYVQMMNFYWRINPDAFLVNENESWFLKLTGAILELPTPLKIILKNINKMEVLFDDGSKEVYERNRLDYKLENPLNYKNIENFYQVLSKLPVEVVDQFIDKYSQIVKYSEIEFEDIKIKCESCGKNIDVAVEPTLFFLLKMLKIF